MLRRCFFIFQSSLEDLGFFSEIPKFTYLTLAIWSRQRRRLPVLWRPWLSMISASEIWSFSAFRNPGRIPRRCLRSRCSKGADRPPRPWPLKLPWPRPPTKPQWSTGSWIGIEACSNRCCCNCCRWNWIDRSAKRKSRKTISSRRA